MKRLTVVRHAKSSWNDPRAADHDRKLSGRGERDAPRMGRRLRARGAKPSLILKGGMIVAAPMGDPNASIPTPQPVHYRPMFGAFGGALAATSVSFVAKAAVDAGVRDELGLSKHTVAVEDTRSVRKRHMVLNDYAPDISVDPETYEVRADGELLTCEPASELPLAQRYLLF